MVQPVVRSSQTIAAAPQRHLFAVLVGTAAYLALGSAMALTWSSDTPAWAQEVTPSTITVTAGKEFTITLPSNATTGYSWQLVQPPDERIARLARKGFLPPLSQLVGAAGQEAWTFLAVAPGETSLTLHYVRVFEPNQAPAQTYIAKVIVQAGGPEVRFGRAGRDGTTALALAGVAGAVGLVAAGVLVRRARARRSSR